MQVVMNKRILLNPGKKLSADPSCSFREKRKNPQFNSEKWRHRAEGWVKSQFQAFEIHGFWKPELFFNLLTAF